MKLYLCLPEDSIDKEDVKLIWAKNENIVMDELARIESLSDSFRDFVQEKACNFSLLEKFYHNSNGEYAYKFTMPLDFSDSIKEGAAMAGVSCDQYVDDLANKQIREFFSERPKYGERYIEYVESDMEPLFEDEFYCYICRKLILQGDWCNYEVRQIDIPSGTETTKILC